MNPQSFSGQKQKIPSYLYTRDNVLSSSVLDEVREGAWRDKMLKVRADCNKRCNGMNNMLFSLVFFFSLFIFLFFYFFFGGGGGSRTLEWIATS